MTLPYQEAASEPSSSHRIFLPFIDTDPIVDVQLALLLLPVWWWLGIEQFIWPVIFFVVLIKVLYLQRLQLVINPPIRWFFLFLFAVLASSFFIVESLRWLTYIRNFGAFTAGFLVLLVVTNRARSWNTVEKLLNAALLTTLVSGVIGLMAITGIWHPSFQSITGQLLPQAAASTGYGQTIAIRTLGERSWFLGLGDYFRVNGLFLFSNSYSSVLVYGIPFLFYKLGRTQGIRRFWVGLGIILLLINLIYTTGRVATLGLLGGALYFALLHSYKRNIIRIIIGIGLASTILIVLISSFLELTDPKQEGGLIAQTSSVADAFVFARGAGSFTSRFGVYGATLESLADRPFFGWGTERDVEGMELPLGSHSEYLAILYRQGFFGFLIFMALLWSVWRMSTPPGSGWADSPEITFLRYGRWFLVTSIINSIMTDPAVDSSVYVLLWLFIALVLATAHILYRQKRDVSKTY